MMPRFRRKSDVRRPALPESQPASEGPETAPYIRTSGSLPSLVPQAYRTPRPPRPQTSNFLPELPPVSDFRTSLILPHLTRRFTLLRKPSGNPATLDDLRDKLAEQRAKGAENQISEEEEDMILETLDRIRAKNAGSRGGGNEDGSGTDTSQQGSVSQQSLTLPTSQFSPNGRSAKRYSNNLFASGKFRDYTYVRSVAQQKRGRAGSTATTESSSVDNIERSTTPDSSAAASSAQSTPERHTVGVRSTPLAAPAPYSDVSHPMSVAEHRMSKILSPSGFKRASMALEEAMNQIEEDLGDEDEAEEEIVMPRISPASRLPPSANSNDADHATSGGTEFEAGTAMTSDQQVTPEPESLRASPVNGRPGTVSPTPRLPGYVPGMPRPMTPRDFDTDEQRSHSTTPRATSPTHLPGLVDRNVVSPTPFSSLSRRASEATAPRASPQPPSSPASTTSSMFLPRSIHGRLTPEGTNIFSAEAENFFPSSLLANRRRPISPLSGPAFKPLTLSQRPGTPSNVVWNVPNHGAQQKTAAHSRNGSLASEEVAVSNDGHNAYAPNVAENPKLSARSLHSPALPDSPVIDLNPNGAGTASTDDHHASSANTRVESGSSVMTNRLRSPTPTQGTAQSPSSPTFPGLHSSPNRNGHSPQNSTQSDNSNTPFAIPRSTLVFSPIANSSRSSLESAGSSYHSWDTSLHKEHTLFSDRQQSPWHDLSTSTDKTSPASSEDACDAEDIIGQYAGLTKNDFVAIQEKLVSAAMAKFISPPVRDRVPSLRRRRPSTSQSNYSLSGMDTKVSNSAQVQNTSGLDTRPRALNNVSKASALLDSVVDSIQSPRNQTTSSSSNELITRGVSEIEYSSSDRRHKDLADAIFGSQDNDGQDSPVKESYPSMEVPSITVEPSPPNGTTRHPHGNGVSPAGVESSFYSSPRDLRGPRSARIQSPSSTQADLVREVQRKTEAAMAELRRNPETPSDQLRANGLTARKRISPSQISEPRLVSASTSVDTIPLRSPSMSSGHQNSTIGDKLRRLRGTLRVKQATIPNGDEVTPYPLTMQSPPPQLARADSRPNTISARDSTGFKAPVTSPPASAGPSIRGFLGRLRRPRTMNNPSELDRLDRRPTSNADSGAAFSPAASLPVSPMSPVYLRSAPPTTAVFNPALPERTAPAYSNSLDVDENPGNLTETEDRVARKRFLDAASTLGLDEDEVQDLLARRSSNRITATSPTSRHIPANSHARPISPPGNTDPPSTNARAPVAMNDAHERSRSRKPNAPTALDGDAARNDDTPVRKLSFRRRLDPQHEAQSDRAANAIVRRTIIFASESTPTIDLNSILRRSSQSKNRRRSSSGGSIRSSRSVHDRAPTPPPPRSPSSKRFSRDSPPVPKLPPSFAAQAENMLQQSLAVPAPSPIEKTSSTYDSLYEMYTGDTRAVSSFSSDLDKPQALQNLHPEQHFSPSDSGPALEVIELANGETIWSIVNGLRDDDAESAYPSRVSFASEYSVQEPNGDNVQVMFKESARSESRTSNNSSYAPPKAYFQGKVRPETKVYYSSSAQIGRLIENLSQSMESGTFNFSLPHTPTGRSNASSYHSEAGGQWTLEEDIEQMLGSIARSS